MPLTIAKNRGFCTMAFSFQFGKILNIILSLVLYKFSIKSINKFKLER